MGWANLQEQDRTAYRVSHLTQSPCCQFRFCFSDLGVAVELLWSCYGVIHVCTYICTYTVRMICMYIVDTKVRSTYVHMYMVTYKTLCSHCNQASLQDEPRHDNAQVGSWLALVCSTLLRLCFLWLCPSATPRGKASWQVRGPTYTTSQRDRYICSYVVRPSTFSTTYVLVMYNILCTYYIHTINDKHI